MFRKLIIVCVLLRTFSSGEIDFNICPDGQTVAPSDTRWPMIFSHHFQLSIEITTDIETLQMNQLFLAPYRDKISFHYDQINLQIYDDFQLNERLIINEQFACQRSNIGSNEYLPFVISQYIKPSILYGFDGRNHYNPTFYTRYIGKEIIRGGIITRKFQSCFYIDQHNLTINASYYLIDVLPTNTAADILQIDIRSNNYPYTYNIIEYISNPSMMISTPSGVFCPNRIDTKEFPRNLPSYLFFHTEEYTLPNDVSSEKFDSTSRLIDQSLQFERIDYHMTKNSTSNRLLIDHALNYSYIYTQETQQCQIIPTNIHSMRTTYELLFQFDNDNHSIEYHYTGLSECGREYAQCHRWIGQRDLDSMIEQFEWYLIAEYNQIDFEEFLPIKVNLKTILKKEPREIIEQEINIFNYNSWPYGIETIDTTIGQCYRTLGPNYHLNYAILRLTLNNDEKYPVYQYLLSLEHQLHLQLANDLQIRHLRLSSFDIDVIGEDIYATFTLIDNPMSSSDFLNEPSLFELIQQLTRQINYGHFHVLVEDGAFNLHARRDSLRILVFYLSSFQNQTYHFNDTNILYGNITQREISVYKYIGWQIIALWTGSILLSLIGTLVLGFFIALHKWKPIIHP